MKPITECKQQEQDYRQKMSACNVSYRHKRSGPKTEQGIREKKLVLVFERIVQPLLHFFVFEIFFPILDHFEHVKS